MRTAAIERSCVGLPPSAQGALELTGGGELLPTSAAGAARAPGLVDREVPGAPPSTSQRITSARYGLRVWRARAPDSIQPPPAEERRQCDRSSVPQSVGVQFGSERGIRRPLATRATAAVTVFRSSMPAIAGQPDPLGVSIGRATARPFLSQRRAPPLTAAVPRVAVRKSVPPFAGCANREWGYRRQTAVYVLQYMAPPKTADLKRISIRA